MPDLGGGVAGGGRKRVVVLISGSGSNLAAVMTACADGRLDADVVLVISNRRDTYGLVRAAEAGIPTAYHPLKPYRDRGDDRRDYDRDLADLVAAAEPDAVVLAGWMHILSSAFGARFPDRVINLHPALPGQFPGATAVEDAMAAFGRGEVDRTGVMVHLVPDERVDEGPVLASRTIVIEADDTVDSLRQRIHAVEHELLVEALAEYLGDAER